MLNKNERRRLDGFQLKCLRQILNVARSYYSRVSNERVLAMGRKKPLNKLIMRHQIIYMGKIAFRSSNDAIRNFIFEPNTFNIRSLPGPAKRSRPRVRWPAHISNMCVRIAGFYDQLLDLWDIEKKKKKLFCCVENHVRKNF